jgi:hypothetical protein
MTALEIIQSLGGVTALSQSLGIPLTTVSSWGRHNSIPEWRRPAILRLAMEKAVALSTADFPAKEAA